MRQFRSSRLPRLAPMLAGVAAAALLLGAQPARAEGVPTSFVLTFTDQSRSGNPELGRLAAQRLSDALLRYGARAVVPDGRLNETARELKFRAPFNQNQRLLLAAKLDAHQAIFGSVSSVRFDPGPEAQGHVRMTVVIESPATGAPLHALVVEGSSKIHKEADQASLLQEALDHASAQVASVLQVNTVVGAPFLIASAQGTPAPGTPAPVAPNGVSTAPVVNGVTVDELGATVPPPVVVDAAGIDRDFGTTRRRRQIISTRTARTLVGGILLLALLGVATGGPLGALGPALN